MKSVSVNLSNDLCRINGCLDKLQQMIKYAVENRDQTILNILSCAYVQILDYSKLIACMLNTKIPEEKWKEILQELRTRLDPDSHVTNLKKEE